MKKVKYDVCDTEGELMFLIDVVKNVAENYEEKSESLKKHLGDYLTVDIATEWCDFLIKDVNILYDKGIFDQTIVDLFKKIDERFLNASNGILYEKAIWTLEGLKCHPFWVEQRELAKKLLSELKKD